MWAQVETATQDRNTAPAPIPCCVSPNSFHIYNIRQHQITCLESAVVNLRILSLLESCTIDTPGGEYPGPGYGPGASLTGRFCNGIGDIPANVFNSLTLSDAECCNGISALRHARNSFRINSSKITSFMPILRVTASVRSPATPSESVPFRSPNSTCASPASNFQPQTSDLQNSLTSRQICCTLIPS